MTNHLTTCAVLCTIWRDDSNPDVGAKVEAILNRFDVQVESTARALGGFIAPMRVTTVTDDNGECMLNLWPNQLGSTASTYTIKITSSTGQVLTTTATVPNAPNAELHLISSLPAYAGKTDGQINLEAVIAAAAQAQAAVDQLNGGDALDPSMVDGFVAFSYVDEFDTRHIGRIGKAELAALMAPLLNSMVKSFDLVNPLFIDDGVLFDLPEGFTSENFTLRTVSAGESDFVLIGDAVVRDNRVFMPSRDARLVDGVRYVATGVKL